MISAQVKHGSVYPNRLHVAARNYARSGTTPGGSYHPDAGFPNVYISIFSTSRFRISVGRKLTTYSRHLAALWKLPGCSSRVLKSRWHKYPLTQSSREWLQSPFKRFTRLSCEHSAARARSRFTKPWQAQRWEDYKSRETSRMSTFGHCLVLASGPRVLKHHSAAQGDCSSGNMVQCRLSYIMALSRQPARVHEKDWRYLAHCLRQSDPKCKTKPGC